MPAALDKHTHVGTSIVSRLSVLTHSSLLPQERYATVKRFVEKVMAKSFFNCSNALISGVLSAGESTGTASQLVKAVTFVLLQI